MQSQRQTPDAFTAARSRNDAIRMYPTGLRQLGAQCGCCPPGMIMASEALLRQNPHAGREQIRAALGGNLCRCTGYVKIVDAVEAASRAGEIA